MDLAKIAAARQKIRADKGLPPLAEPLKIGGQQNQFEFKAPVSKATAIAALYILKVSYGQLMTLFRVSKSTVYGAVMRGVPANLRQLRGAGRGRPLLAHEQASMYFERIKDAGPHESPITLAAKLHELTKNEDWTE